jgi:hypothetical protein
VQGRRNVFQAAVVAAIVASGLAAPRPAVAYSVLAQEANVDGASALAAIQIGAMWPSTPGYHKPEPIPIARMN